MNKNFIFIGRIVGVHGIKGWVKLHSECRPREAIFRYKRFLIKSDTSDEMRTIELKGGRLQGKGLVAHFAEVNDRNQAYALINHSLFVTREQLPDLLQDEYYWHDLIGLQVINQQHKVLGTVKSLFETGANDIMIIDNHGQEILIPFILNHYIVDVNLLAKQIIVDWEEKWSKPH